jgi:hypothetical protein
LSILTIVIQLELNNDTLIEVESATFNNRCSIAKLNVAIWLKKLANLFGSDGWTKLAFNEEET